jgi:hypothetical protein
LVQIPAPPFVVLQILAKLSKPWVLVFSSIKWDW